MAAKQAKPASIVACSGQLTDRRHLQLETARREVSDFPDPWR